MRLALLFVAVGVGCGQAETGDSEAPDSSSSAQPRKFPSEAKMRAAIREGARQAAGAIVDRDYETLIDWTYPKLVRRMGGRERMLEAFQQGTRDMDSRGVRLLSVEIGEPEQLTHREPYVFAVVPESLTMQYPDGKASTHSVLIAISQDNGRTWKFIDRGPHDEDTIRGILAYFPSTITLPDVGEVDFQPE
jgi:hypothetical protein